MFSSTCNPRGFTWDFNLHHTWGDDMKDSLNWLPIFLKATPERFHELLGPFEPSDLYSEISEEEEKEIERECIFATKQPKNC
jgi:hypothetical protein